MGIEESQEVADPLTFFLMCFHLIKKMKHENLNNRNCFKSYTYFTEKHNVQNQ